MFTHTLTSLSQLPPLLPPPHPTLPPPHTHTHTLSHTPTQYLYIESILNDVEVLEANYRQKMMFSPDYKGVDMEVAMKVCACVWGGLQGVGLGGVQGGGLGGVYGGVGWGEYMGGGLGVYMGVGWGYVCIAA